MTEKDKYFTITSIEDNNSIGFKILESSSSLPTVNMEYRIGTGKWAPYTTGDYYTLNIGEFIQFRNDSKAFNVEHGCRCIDSTGSFNASGNLQSLVDYKNLNTTSRPVGSLCKVFKNSKLIDASELIILPGSATVEMNQIFAYSTLRSAPKYVAWKSIGGYASSWYQGCANLEEVPDTYAESASTSSFSNFYEGTAIKKTPRFRFNSNSITCFHQCYLNCQQLEEAIIDWNPTGSNGNQYMFQGCTNLTKITFRGDAINWSSCRSWLNQASSTGTFYYTYKDLDIESIPRTTSGIPSGWSIEYLQPEYLCVTSKDTSTITVSFTSTAPTSLALEYTIDDPLMEDMWTEYTPGETIEIDPDTSIYFRNSSGTLNSSSNTVKFVATGRYELTGDVSTLVNYKDPGKDAPAMAYQLLFANTNCVDASGMYFGNKRLLEKSCYQMFKGCTSLTQGPNEIPYIAGKNACTGMFQGCTSLLEAPELPSLIVYHECYNSMFDGCTNLTKTPSVIPVASLSAIGTQATCTSMFQNCKNITSGPKLPSISIDGWGYAAMFSGCSKLTEAPELPAEYFGNDAYSQMFRGCTSLTEAPVLPDDITTVNNLYREMFSGCTSLTKGPDISVKTFGGQNPLYQMFNGCSKLNEIVYHASTFSSGYFSNWLNGVSATGTFYYTDPDLDVASIPRAANGIPPGWLIVYMGPGPSLVLTINGKPVAKLMINGKEVVKLG